MFVCEQAKIISDPGAVFGNRAHYTYNHAPVSISTELTDISDTIVNVKQFRKKQFRQNKQLLKRQQKRIKNAKLYKNKKSQCYQYHR